MADSIEIRPGIKVKIIDKNTLGITTIRNPRVKIKTRQDLETKQQNLEVQQQELGIKQQKLEERIIENDQLLAILKEE